MGWTNRKCGREIWERGGYEINVRNRRRRRMKNYFLHPR
jgi:hypothetical protein